MKHALKIVAAAVVASGLAACSSPQAPPPQYYELRLEAPEAASVSPASAGGVWQLMAPVKLPEHLERDVIWLPAGNAGLQPLPGHRWAEPLDEAVPRILLHDLAQLRGTDGVWSGALPSNLAVSKQLRVQILELAVAGDSHSVHLTARCSLTGAGVGTPGPPRVFEVRVSAPIKGADPDALVAAHRLALWRLAQEIVRGAQP
jgi:uncharacterized lipoprotein YmbA